MQENIQDIMRYESDIWSVADLLIAASVKQSDFPAYMMPFFAVMMLEGRMRNAAKAVEAEFGVSAAETLKTGHGIATAFLAPVLGMPGMRWGLKFGI